MMTPSPLQARRPCAIRMADRVVTCDETGRRVLLDLRRGCGWTLDRVGAALLDTLLAGGSPLAAAHQLTGLRPMSVQRAAGEVEQLLRELELAGLVTAAC